MKCGVGRRQAAAVLLAVVLVPVVTNAAIAANASTVAYYHGRCERHAMWTAGRRAREDGMMADQHIKRHLCDVGGVCGGGSSSWTQTGSGHRVEQ